MDEEQRKAIYEALHDPNDEREPGHTWWGEPLGSPSPLSYEDSLKMTHEERLEFWTIGMATIEDGCKIFGTEPPKYIQVRNA